MKKEIAIYWQELSLKFKPIQVFYILVNTILTSYQKSQPCSNTKTCNLYSESHSIDIDRIYDYDTKEAAMRLRERVEWTLIENDNEIRDIIEAVETRLNTYFMKDVKGDSLYALNELISSLIELSGKYNIYSTTPFAICEIAANILKGTKAGEIANFDGGAGCMGLYIWSGLEKNDESKYYCSDNEPCMCDIAVIMAHFYGIRQAKIERRNILNNEQRNEKYDFIISDVPKGNNKNIMADLSQVLQDSFELKNVFTEWIYILNVVKSMKDCGKAVVIVTTGALIRKNEAELRKMLIEKDMLEAVITLPNNMYPNTSIAAEMLVLNKNKEDKRKGKVLFVDISNEFYRDARNSYTVTEEGIYMVDRIFADYIEVENISVIKKTDEIEKTVFSLKPKRYIIEEIAPKKSENKLYLKDVAEITRGVQLNKNEEEELCRNGNVYYLNIKNITEEGIDYCSAKKIKPKNESWYSKFLIRPGDIVITSKGTSFKTAIVGHCPQEAFISGNLTIIRVDREKYNPYVLYEYLISEHGRRNLESIQSGTTIRVLNNTNLLQMEIPRYDLDTMFKIGEQLEEKHEKYHANIKLLKENYVKEKKELLQKIDGIN